MRANDSTGETTMIRTLSTAATLVALVLLTLGLLGGPAWAQYPPTGGGGGGGVTPSPSPVPSDGEATFVVGTPGATITIIGNNWAKAKVTVERKDGSTSTSPASADPDAAVFSTTVSADSSGRLAPVALPEDLEPGEYELVVEGTDASGEERTEVQRLAVQGAGGPQGALATSGVTNLELFSALGLGALALGAVALRRARART